MKKNNAFGLSVAVAVTAILVSSFSCSNLFQPYTSVGKDVITDVDPTITDLKNGFKQVYVDLSVSNTRSIIIDGKGVSIDSLVSGVQRSNLTIGSLYNESSIGYIELNMYDIVKNGGKNRFTGSYDSSAYDGFLRLYHVWSHADSVAFSDSNLTITFSVYSCPIKQHGSKFDPAKIASPGAPVLVVDSTRGADNILRFDTIQETVPKLDTTITFKPTVDSVLIVHLPAAIFAELRDAVRDTSTDSTTYLKRAYCIKASAGHGLVRFTSPQFVLKYHTSKTDTSGRDSTALVNPYNDLSVFEQNQSDDSLVASWEAGRFVEIPINMKPLRDSLAPSLGKRFTISQDAACSLWVNKPLLEVPDTTDTLRILEYKMVLSELESKEQVDSLINMKTVELDLKSQKINLALKPYFQDWMDNGMPDIAYLYLFVKPDQRWSRIGFNKTQTTIHFRSLFSNPHN